MKLIAHRGGKSVFPENTIKAFGTALKNGADAIELDIHFTKDNKIVVHHDYCISISERNVKPIYELTYTDIQQVDLGSHCTVPTLEEVFAVFGNSLDYEIELKGFTVKFLEVMADIAQRFRLENRIEFTSPLSYNLTVIKQLMPRAKTGVFISEPPDWMSKKLAQDLALHNVILGRHNVIHYPISLIDKRAVDHAHSNNILVHAANCNSKAEIAYVSKLGVDQASTDNLEMIRLA